MKMMKIYKEVTHVICIKSDWQQLFEVGKTYKLIEGIPNIDGYNFRYTWNNPIRNRDNNLAQFKKVHD